MNAFTFPKSSPAEIAEAFKPIAANISAGVPWAGYPCLRIIELHAGYLAREAIAADEAFASGNERRFAKRRADLLETFAKLEAEMAEFKARIDGSPTPPTEPASMARAA